MIECEILSSFRKNVWRHTRRIAKGRSLTVLPWQLSLFQASTVWLGTVRRSFCVGRCLTIGVWPLVLDTLMPITGAPGRQHGGVWICIDSRLCMLVSALSVWTAVLDYTQLFGVGWASKFDRIFLLLPNGQRWCLCKLGFCIRYRLSSHEQLHNLLVCFLTCRPKSIKYYK